MFSNLTSTYKGIILALIGFSAFAVSDTCMKWLTGFYPTPEIIVINAAIMLIILAIFSRKLGGFKKTFQTQKLKIHILRGLAHTSISIIAVLSFSKLPLAQIYTLFFVAPFIATMISIPMFKEKVDWHGWVAIAGGFSGVILVFRPGMSELDPWLLLPLFGAFMISALFILARLLCDKETLLSLTLFPSLSNLIFLLPFALPFISLPALEHIPLFLLSSVLTIIATSCITLAFRTTKSSIVGPFHYTQIIWAIIFGYFIFGDVPDIWVLLGASAIIGSGMYLILKEYRGAESNDFE